MVFALRDAQEGKGGHYKHRPSDVGLRSDLVEWVALRVEVTPAHRRRGIVRDMADIAIDWKPVNYKVALSLTALHILRIEHNQSRELMLSDPEHVR